MPVLNKEVLMAGGSGSGIGQETPLETALRMTGAVAESEALMETALRLTGVQFRAEPMSDEEIVRLIEMVLRRTFRRFQEKLPSGDDYVRRAVDRLMEELLEITLQSYSEVRDARWAGRKVRPMPRKPLTKKR